MKLTALLVIAIVPLLLNAAYFTNLPTEVTQPDGTVLHLYASGDEFANRLHDAEGYTIIQSHADGYFYYAQQDRSVLAPSVWKAGTTDPKTKNLTPNLNITPDEYRKKVRLMSQHDNPAVKMPSSGTVNNLAIFIRFADQTEFDTPRQHYDGLFNATQDDASSVRNYFSSVSYNQLNMVTHLYPDSPPDVNLSYQDSYPRNYYIPYNPITNPTGYANYNQRISREQTLLANAVAAVQSQIPSTLNIDADNDGYVDNVCFIIRGPHTAWAELLWAHRWYLYYADAFIHGKQVGDYTFQPENHVNDRVLCHELFHSIGSPDLYHYNFDGITPVGCWDIMESGTGHMGAYMKWKYGGWLPPPMLLTQAGTYYLNPLTSPTDTFYRINYPVSNQYLLLEYRKKGSDFFEAFLPESGLLVYRINPDQYGNSEGPPDEVYIFRPDGTSTFNGQIAQAAFSSDNYRMEYNYITNPSTGTIQGTPIFLSIYNIGSCGDNISFQFDPNGMFLSPVVEINSPADGAILYPGSYVFNISSTPGTGSLTQLELKLDGNLIGIYDSGSVQHSWIATENEAGYHELVAKVTNSNGLISIKRIRFRVIDPLQENWFRWTTDNPVYTTFGRGVLPLMIAIDLDLGSEEFLVKKVAFNIEPDAFGSPQYPGLVDAKINRFASGQITDQTLLHLGYLTSPLNGPYEVSVTDTTRLSGKIALILNIFEYQRMVFDANGVVGHSWITEPNRPWMDALSRGVPGAADIGLKLQAIYTGIEEDVLLPKPQLAVYPNPFYDKANFSFQLAKDSEVALEVFNLKGQKVVSIYRGKQAKGSHTLLWDGLSQNGSEVANGIYLVRLSENGKPVSSKKLVLCK